VVAQPSVFLFKKKRFEYPKLQVGSLLGLSKPDSRDAIHFFYATIVVIL
jgi:hypothetical protein